MPDRSPSGADRGEGPGDAARPPAAPPRDAGRTSGGGSLGHKQPQDVAEETNIRNQPSDHRPDEPAQGEVQQ